MVQSHNIPRLVCKARIDSAAVLQHFAFILQSFIQQRAIQASTINQ
jgi:hypothetical protein